MTLSPFDLEDELISAGNSSAQNIRKHRKLAKKSPSSGSVASWTVVFPQWHGHARFGCVTTGVPLLQGAEG